mgnify:FL=1
MISDFEDMTVIEEDEIYKENILDHYKHPRNFGNLKNYTFKSKEFNPVCGDEIEIFIKFENGKIIEAKFIGRGCAISQASVSMLTDYLESKTLDQVKSLSKEDILEMLGIQIGIVRMNCALLPLKALHSGVEKYER